MTDRTKAGISREAALGESGHVIKIPEEDRRGIVQTLRQSGWNHRSHAGVEEQGSTQQVSILHLARGQTLRE